MPEPIEILMNGKPFNISPGCTVATAMALAGAACRTSVSGQPRGPLCAMGTCFECRATVNGKLHTRTCQILCESGMEVNTA
jgi:D-hydroxyproline dehydrogenase subunit gamma